MDEVSVKQTEIDNSKRPWAISAIVLGGLYLLTSLWALAIAIDPALLPSKQPAMPEEFHTAGLILNVVSVLLSIGFIAGGAASLRGNRVAMIGLSYVSLAAVADTFLTGYFQYLVTHSDAYTAMITEAYAKNGLSGDQAAKMIKMIGVFGLGSLIVFGLIQTSYCLILYFKISAEPAAE